MSIGPIQIVIVNMRDEAIRKHVTKLKDSLVALNQEANIYESSIIDKQVCLQEIRKAIAEAEAVIAKLEA